jgi:hypothetical protein
MGCPFIKIPSLIITAVLLGQSPVSVLQAASPPLQAPPPLPPEILNNPPPQPPPDLPDPSELIAQLKQLDELLSMSPEKLRKLRQTVEFIEKMSDAEREAMRIRLSQVTRMTDDLRQEIATLSKIVPKIPRSDISQFWLAESDARREQMRASLAALPAAEQAALLQSWISEFVVKRDEVFRQMKQVLEAKKAALNNSPD